MARIRSLKPEFWDDRKLARSTSRDARMLYMGLWNQADEHSRLNGDVAWLKGRVFAFDDDITLDVLERLLSELEQSGRIVRYAHDGDPFIYLPKLAKHQRLETSKVESRLPEPPAGADTDMGESAPRTDQPAPRVGESALLYVAGSMDQGAGGWGQGAGSDGVDAALESEPSPYCSKHPQGTEKPCGPCGGAARRNRTWHAERLERETAALAAAAEARARCPTCDQNGLLERPDGRGLMRCDHQPESRAS